MLALEQTKKNKEISHYEIKGFKNIKAGFIFLLETR